MGVMPVNRLLITMSLPMMISMLVQALYNVVDSFFVSYISEDALAAVGLAFPAQNLMISVAVGTGVGINALLSKSLGEKNYDTANRTAVNGIFLAFCSWVVFAVLGGLFSRTFMELQTPVESIADYGTTYLAIVSVVSVGMMFQICFERLLQSTGKTIYTMISQAVGAIINIIMDPLLIFGIGPFPQMGIAGAAYATVIGQVLTVVLQVLYFRFWKNHPIRRDHLLPDPRRFVNIAALGSAAFFNQVACDSRAVVSGNKAGHRAASLKKFFQSNVFFFLKRAKKPLAPVPCSMTVVCVSRAPLATKTIRLALRA